MLGLDVDNVLALTSPAILAQINQRWQTSYLESQITVWDVATALSLTPEQAAYLNESFATPAWYAPLEPVPYAQLRIKAFFGKQPVVYITSRPASCAGVTRDWLRQHHFPLGDVVVTSNKVQACLDHQVNLMVEDSLAHATAIAAVSKVLLLNYPWNQAVLPPRIQRFPSWAQLPSVLR